MNKDFKSNPISHSGTFVCKETTTPTPIADYGQYYFKSDNVAYYQDGAGTEHPIADVTNNSVEANLLSSTISEGTSSVITGSIDPTNSRAVVGVGTLFNSEVAVGDRLTVSGETATVIDITDDTNLTVADTFSNNANDTSPEVVKAILRLSAPFFLSKAYLSLGTTNITEALSFNGTTSGNGVIGHNFYYSTLQSRFQYFDSDVSNRLLLSGSIFFQTATSGTAGDEVTFTTRFTLKNNGNIVTPYLSNGTGNAVNINATTGELYENTSSAQFKENIVDCPYGLNEATLLKPRKYNRKESSEIELGLIAEEVHDAGLTELVVYKNTYDEYATFKTKEAIDNANKEGDKQTDYSIYDWCQLKKERNETPTPTQTIPYGVNYSQLSVLNLNSTHELHALIQSQATTIADLVKRIELLEAK